MNAFGRLGRRQTTNVPVFSHIRSLTGSNQETWKVQRSSEPSAEFGVVSHLTSSQRLIKRTLDLLIGAGAICAFSPIMLVAAFAIRLESSGPIIFRQRRLGLDGQQFTILKFRTLRVGNMVDENMQVTRQDARLTRVGRVLRRTSLDELPQLYNVLQGSMSIAGPRPHAVGDDLYFEQRVGNYRSRRFVKPGMTGLAQVSGARGEIRELDDMVRRVDLDLHYIARWSVTLELRIYFLTVFRGFTNISAY